MKTIYIYSAILFAASNTVAAAELERSEVLFNARITASKIEVLKPGTMAGRVNNARAVLTINKTDRTIKGGVNSDPVDIVTDHQNARITGSIGVNPVNLAYAWRQDGFFMEGWANASPVRLMADWKGGILTGYAGKDPLRLEFGIKEGQMEGNIVILTGYTGNFPTALSFDGISGRLTGVMNGYPVEIALANCDLYDFLTYLFLFL